MAGWQVCFDAGNAAMVKELFVSVFSPERGFGAVLPQQAQDSKLDGFRLVLRLFPSKKLVKKMSHLYPTIVLLHRE